MARDDNEIKGEIIGEIEEIEDPATGKSLLDALMVERVEVDKGHVTIDLVFDDDRPRQERWDIENEVQDAIEDIEGIEDIDIFAHTRSAVEAASDTSSSPTEPEPESAPDAFAADAVEEDGERDGESRVSVYSGGGCSAGTVASPSVTVAAAPAT
ncbi:MAG: iron-sulfur cluster assembly protein, partial [Myxococcota bacterium]